MTVLRDFVIALVLAHAVLAADNSDVMKGIGMPIVFMALMLVAGFVAKDHFINAAKAVQGDRDQMWVFGIAVLNALFSIIFYWTPAWNYGLVSTVLAFGTAVVCSRKSTNLSVVIMGVNLIWFLTLVGIPDGVSAGLIKSVDMQSCNAWYKTYNTKMCHEAWVVIVLILATVQVGLTLLGLLTVVAAGVASLTKPADGTGIAEPLNPTSS